MGGQRHASTALPPEKRASTQFTGGWVGPIIGLDGCGNLTPTGTRSPDYPVSSRSLHRVIYSGPQFETKYIHFMSVSGSKFFPGLTSKKVCIFVWVIYSLFWLPCYLTSRKWPWPDKIRCRRDFAAKKTEQTICARQDAAEVSQGIPVPKIRKKQSGAAYLSVWIPVSSAAPILAVWQRRGRQRNFHIGFHVTCERPDFGDFSYFLGLFISICWSICMH